MIVAAEDLNTGLTAQQIMQAFTKALASISEQSVNLLLGDKVDKVNGKGLSTNDLTDALLEKLNALKILTGESPISVTSDGKIQAATATGSNYGVVKIGSSITSDGSDPVSGVAVYTALLSAIKSVPTMITSMSNANQVCGGNLNNLPKNSVVCIGAVLTDLINKPSDKFVGLVVTAAYNPNSDLNGIIQLAVSSSCDLYIRIKWGSSGIWKSWMPFNKLPEIYYVGGSSSNQSLTELFGKLKNDTNEKIIYVLPGTYDIFKEYRDLGVPSPPDDVTSGDYLDRCVFMPPNTKLIGIGNVLLKYRPSLAQTTKGEARTWSPLNVRYACYVENIEINCHYCRYGIHDDSHNAVDDQGVSHIYKNVRVTYDYSDNAYGFNNTIGFGFSQKNNYVFEDCIFIFNETESSLSKDKPAFYGHGASGSVKAEESPNIIVRNCAIISGETSNRSMRLQSMNTSQIRIRTLVESTYIRGYVSLTSYQGTHPQAYDVTFLNCGITSDRINIDYDQNIYTPAIYEDHGYIDSQIATRATYAEVFGAGIELTENSNLNSILSPGKFYCSSANSTTVSNLPVSLSSGISFNVMSYGIYGENRFLQLFMFNVGSGPFHGRLWYRFYSISGWSSWEEIATLQSAYGKGDSLVTSTDLDNVITFGRYNATKQIAKTLVHSPFDNLELGLQLTVECNAIHEASSTRCIQTITYNATTVNTNQFAKIFRRFLSQDGWSNWFVYSGTELP